jgi:hypothetical protein
MILRSMHEGNHEKLTKVCASDARFTSGTYSAARSLSAASGRGRNSGGKERDTEPQSAQRLTFW